MKCIGRLGAWISGVVVIVQLVGCEENISARSESGLGQLAEQAYPGETGPVGEIEYEVYGERLPLSYMAVRGEMVLEGDIILGEEVEELEGELGVSEEALAARTSSGL